MWLLQQKRAVRFVLQKAPRGVTEILNGDSSILWCLRIENFAAVQMVYSNKEKNNRKLVKIAKNQKMT